MQVELIFGHLVGGYPYPSRLEFIDMSGWGTHSRTYGIFQNLGSGTMYIPCPSAGNHTFGDILLRLSYVCGTANRQGMW